MDPPGAGESVPGLRRPPQAGQCCRAQPPQAPLAPYLPQSPLPPSQLSHPLPTASSRSSLRRFGKGTRIPRSKALDHMKHFAILLIRGYRLLLSPFLPPACRFQPTCSEYAEEALAKHGVFKGSYIALRRVGRCHPWGGSGYDPVH